MSEPPSSEPDGYQRNGVWVLRDAEPDPQPPGWSERLVAWLDRRLGDRWRDRRWWLLGAAVVMGVVVVVALASGKPARMPDEQKQFLDIVQRGQHAVREGNDITLVTASRERASAACTLLPRDGRVEDWVGTLDKVDTVYGGEAGRASVRLAHDVKLRTWNRSSEDGKDHTLVDPHSDVYQSLAGLHDGDAVRFSGVFLRDGASCLHETSVFAKNGMLTPSFVFRFTQVDPR
jgi:hypothetical protein